MDIHHTPSPWFVDQSTGCVYAEVKDGDDVTLVRVADCVPPDDDLDLLSEEEPQSNLNVIGMAPRMFRILKQIADGRDAYNLRDSQQDDDSFEEWAVKLAKGALRPPPAL